jgi:hypothetical protein
MILTSFLPEERLDLLAFGETGLIPDSILSDEGWQDG